MEKAELVDFLIDHLRISFDECEKTITLSIIDMDGKYRIINWDNIPIPEVYSDGTLAR